MEQKTKAVDVFDELEPEEKQEFKDLEVESNPRLEAIIKGFETLVDTKFPEHEDANLNAKEFYEKSEQHLPESYTAEDVEKFSFFLQRYQEKDKFSEKAGLFLGALINNCKEGSITIHTKHLERNIDYIGYSNKEKYITINGDAGCDLGSLMEGGEVHVRGNAIGNTGHQMYGGKLYIKGNVIFGSMMISTSGLIILTGKPRLIVGGPQIFGGEIHVDGHSGDLGMFPKHGGDVYNKGELIVKDGKKLECD